METLEQDAALTIRKLNELRTVRWAGEGYVALLPLGQIAEIEAVINALVVALPNPSQG